nr:uncharacterized protein LOC111508090 [Leptinotarsa decemlineata]
MTTISSINFCIGRFLIDKRRIGNNLPFEAYIPECVPFEVLFVYQCLIAFLLVISMFAMDILILTIITLMAIQFEVLNRAIVKIFEDMPNSCEDYCSIKMRLKKYNDHHTFLMGFRDQVNNTFSAGMLAYMGVIIPTQCIELYVLTSQSSAKESIRAILYATTMFFEFFVCYCLPAQHLADEVDKLSENIYCSKWYKYPQYSKDVLILVGKFQLKMLISAGGFANIDLKTGFAALKTMVSYCMFLRTMGYNSEA